MKDVGFKKEITTGRYLNPFNGFEEKEITIELRYDEITGVACRILPYRVRPAQKPDLDFYLEKSPESLCPFCSDLFEKTTPKFTAEYYCGRKISDGEKPVCFPTPFLTIKTTLWLFFRHGILFRWMN